MAFTQGNECIVLSKSASGARYGYSGDPAVKGRDCTSCHSDGPAAQMKSGWITSNIPVTGYVPNTTYTINATATGAGHSKFGFEVSPQNNLGTFLGTLISTNSDTKLTTNSPSYITSTSAGTSGNGSKTWTFNWTAPAKGSGPVTFYGAFNITNSDYSNSGDTIMLSTLSVLENQNTSIEDLSNKKQKISVYPNPTIDFVTIESDNSIIGTTYKVSDLTGKVVLTEKINAEKTIIDVSRLNSGMYIIEVSDQNKQTFKVQKK
jgi:Secretion system C-terminal sorting domain/Reeler domain